jgi:hypothetical protein
MLTVSVVRSGANTEPVPLPPSVLMNLHLSTSTCVVSECMVQQYQATRLHQSHRLSAQPWTRPDLRVKSTQTNPSKFAVV